MDFPDPRLDPSRKFSAEDRSRYVYAVARGRSRSAAAKEVGVSYALVRKALAVDSAFRDAVEGAEEEKWDLAEEKLMDALREGEPWAVRLVVKESVGTRDRWKAAPEAVDVSIGLEVGPGVERVLALQERLAERERALGVGVLDVESSEVESGA